MQIHESTWNTPDGVRLYTRQWLPEAPTRAVVVLVHGLGEHCARYDHVAAFLTGHGIQVSSFDHRGHGRSQGTRGHIPSYDHVNGDLDHFLAEAAQASPGRPVFLYGHSMGGAMVLYYGLTRQPKIAGVICTSPGIGSENPQSQAKILLGKILYRIAPSMTVPNGLDFNNLSHDRAVVQAYQSDPLNTGQVSARLGLDLLNNGPWIVSQAAHWTLPILLMQGGGDHLVSPAATRKFAAGVAKDLITYKEWDGLFHELHNEPEKDQVFQTIQDWIDARIGE